MVMTMMMMTWINLCSTKRFLLYQVWLCAAFSKNVLIIFFRPYRLRQTICRHKTTVDTSTIPLKAHPSERPTAGLTLRHIIGIDSFDHFISRLQTRRRDSVYTPLKLPVIGA